MTNKVALGIGLVVIAFLAIDYALGLGFGLFLARKFVDLINALAFWR
ncbi:MAG: hypothetical protein OXQ92_12275 [Boseongicola sp.]|nr:hypothetical protein [Boseongicola sp.]MDD9978249.1 hypothetical protein [Boseongicola sp.]